MIYELTIKQSYYKNLMEFSIRFRIIIFIMLVKLFLTYEVFWCYKEK